MQQSGFQRLYREKNERERESIQGKNDIQALANCRNTLYLSLFLRICYLTSNFHFFLREKRENRTFFH